MNTALASAAASTTRTSTASFHVSVDETREVILDAAPGAIIVGNPAIAGVRLHKGTLLVTGKASGETRIDVVDEAGQPLWSSQIAVRAALKLRAA